MSHTQLPAYSYSNFQLIFNNALRAYQKRTNNDLRALPFTAQLDACNSPAAVVLLLRQQAQELDQSRSGNEGLSNRLGPTVNVLYAFSARLGESLGLAFPPAATVFAGIHVLLVAARNIESQDTLVDIFERLEHFFRRLEIYIEIPPTPEMMDTIVQVMVEMLSILGIATKEIKKRRMRKYVTKLIGRTDLEDALSKLDKLTQEEARMAAAEALKVMHTADERVRGVADKVLAIDGRVAYLEARVADVNHAVTGAEEMALSPNTTAVNAVSDIDNKVASVSDGLKGVEPMVAHFDDRVKAVNEKLFQVMDDGNEAKRVLKQVKPRLWENIYKWLSPPDPSPNHNIAFKARHKGTGTWFLQGSVFQQWKGTSSLLWIYGTPGSGKSVLCSTIIQDIRAMCEAGQALMAYFYFDFRDINKQHLRDLLLSLLVQLTAHSNPRCDILLRLYDAHNSGTIQPSDTALEKCLQEILTLPDHRPIYLIMDALDECLDTFGTPSPGEQVLQLVEELVHLYLPNLHICITGRPEFNIRGALEPLASFRVSLHDESGQRADIEEYIKTIVYSERHMRRWKNEDKDLVIKTLSEKADGMYRWVSCMFETLRWCLPPSIRSILAELPEVLDKTYERVLKEIQKPNRDHAHRLFQCLVVAIRPLRVEELAEVLAVDFSHPSGIPRLNPNWRWEDGEQALLASCSTLITIVNSDNSRVVQFAHFSVKEYLTSSRLAASTQDVSRYYIAHEPAHTTLAQACLSTLLQSGGPIKDSPLATYAAQNWVGHAQVENVSSYVREAMEYLFDLDRPYFGAWLRLHDIDDKHRSPATFDTSYPPEISDARPLYYAALCGFDSLTEYLISKYPEQVNTHCGYYVTPLAAALAGNHLGVAELLLKHGADPDVRGDHGETPLHVVSREGNLTVARRLLEIGVDVNSRANYSVEADVDTPDRSGWTPLHVASQQGHVEVVQLLLNRQADVHSRDNDGRTPLMEASQHGHPDVVRMLLEKGATVDSRDNDGWTPLKSASRYGHLDIVCMLLEKGATVDSYKNDDEQNFSTPLHFAITYGYLNLARLLIQSGANVNRPNENRESPLGLAARHGRLAIAHLLLESGSSINFQDHRGSTPLHNGAENDHLDIVTLLLNSGADFNIRNNDDKTCLNMALDSGNLDVARLLIGRMREVGSYEGIDLTPLATQAQDTLPDVAQPRKKGGLADNKSGISLRKAAKEGNLDFMRSSLDSGINADDRGEFNQNPLYLASLEGRVEVAKWLIEHGADVNIQNKSGLAPLHVALENGHLNVVQLLLDHGVDVNARGKDDWTPLHAASAEGQYDIARLLLEHGAEANVLASDHHRSDWTPLHFASQQGHVEVIELLLNFQADVHMCNDENQTALHLASQNGNSKLIRLLINHHANSNAEDEDNETPLFQASRNGRVEASRLLLERRATVDHRDWQKRTPLHAASENGHVDIVRLLLHYNAEVDAQNVYSWTPLHFGSRTGNHEVAKILIDRGAEVNAQNNPGWTPLHMASQKGHLDVVQLLLKRGAAVDTQEVDGETALHLASYYGHHEVAEVLLKFLADRAIKNKEGNTPFDLATTEDHTALAQLLMLPQVDEELNAGAVRTTEKRVEGGEIAL